MKPASVLGPILALLLPAPLEAKGVTARITVTDVRLGTSIHITEPSVLERFNVWAGRGTFVTIAGRETEGTVGFIIDWLAGVVRPPPVGLPRYEVRFFVRHSNSVTEQLVYIVFYARDPSSGRGFVYLPGESDDPYRLNVKAIHRGRNLEGNWFRASRSWQDAVGRLLPAR